MKGGGGGRRRIVDIVAGHERRLDDALEQRLGGALGAALVAEENGLGENLGSDTMKSSVYIFIRGVQRRLHRNRLRSQGSTV
jgi:hypothetical protein